MIRPFMIKLPLPPKACSPNWRGDWRPKAGAVKQFRQDSAAAMISERNKQRNFQPIQRCSLEVTFHVQDKRYVMDDDNARSSLKPAIDALVDAGIVEKNDRGVWIQSVAFIPGSPEAPSLELVVCVPCDSCGIAVGPGHRETILYPVGRHHVCGVCYASLKTRGFVRLAGVGGAVSGKPYSRRLLRPDGKIIKESASCDDDE